MDAQRALLHDAAAAHDHVGVQDHALERPAPVVVEPVEAARLGRAVVGAVTGADAAVVDLLVQPLAGVHRRHHGADRLAGGVLAVLAHHRLVQHLGRVGLAAVVAIDAQPVHLAAPARLGLADHRDVVLGVARDHAGGTRDGNA